MNFQKIVFLLAFCQVLIWSGNLQADSKPTSKTASVLVENLREKLDSIRELLNEKRTASESTWIASNKADYQEDINELLDSSIILINPTNRDSFRQRISALDKMEYELKETRSDFNIKLSLAPTVSPEPSLVDKVLQREFADGSHAYFRTALKDVEKQIEAIRSERLEIVESFKNEINLNQSFQLTDAQARSLLYQVNGQDLLDSLVVAEVFIELEAQVAKVMSLDISENARLQYYGVATISRLLQLRVFERHLQDYDVKWLPKLDAIDRRNSVEMLELKKTLSSLGNQNLQNNTLTNIELRQKLKKAVATYRKVLLKRRNSLTEQITFFRKSAKVAIQTLLTLDDIKRFSNLQIQSSNDFLSLRNLKPSELIPLDNGELSEQYLDISQELFGS